MFAGALEGFLCCVLSLEEIHRRKDSFWIKVRGTISQAFCPNLDVIAGRLGPNSCKKAYKYVLVDLAKL